MKRKRHNEQQIVGAVQQAEAGGGGESCLQVPCVPGCPGCGGSGRLRHA